MRTAVRLLVAAALLGGLALAFPFLMDVRQDRVTAHAQARLLDQLAGAVAQSGRTHEFPVADSAATGEPLATMRVPRWGEDWEWAVVEGTDAEQLALGPGHYPRTPLPGARGNVALAGHRAGHGDPFIDFDLLRPGDEVLLTQGDTTWVYILETAPRIIEADAHHVLDPLPGRRLTLTTCWPRYGSSRRMVVTGTLREVLTDSTVSGAPAAPSASPAVTGVRS